MEVELAHQVRAVVFRSLHTDFELLSNLVGAVALCDQLLNLALTLGENVDAGLL